LTKPSKPIPYIDIDVVYCVYACLRTSVLWQTLYMSIPKTKADPSSKQMHNRLHNTKHSLHTPVWILLFMVFTIPTLAHAGAFSFFGDNSELMYERSESHVTSQNVPLLQAAIHNDPNPAKGGAEVIVVDSSALQARSGFEMEESGTIRPKTEQISVYVVREGDTLSQIADMFEVSANTIRWANDLTGSIRPGQQLVILPVTGVKHIVKSGGTIKDLAEIYDADAQEIALFNGISLATRLEVGDEVVVPNGVISAPKNKTVTKATKRSGGSVSVPAASGRSSSGFINPLPGGVRTQGIHGYNGVDLGAPSGTPIYAAADGQAIISKPGGWNGGYGSYVVVKHDNGVQTLYAHMSSVAASQGSWVSQGDIIGYVGNTGRSTGPHLHFEVRGATNPF